jgi:hypothetical protein
MYIICSMAIRRPATRNAAIARKTRVERCPTVQTNVHWPAPVDQRLNELIERLSEAGVECTRSQLLAAVVSATPTDKDRLEQLIRAYRQMTAGAVVCQRTGPIVLMPRKPGRRPR